MNGFGDRTKIWHDNSTPSGTSDRNAAWKDFGSSMSALSFGFLATAILVSMFLIMAIFEHLLRSRASSPPPQSNAHGELDQMHSEKIKKSQNVAPLDSVEFSVLMPGQHYPTYIAQPAPLPCPREGIISWPSHDHHALASP
ncbi:uncharacterized protein LOC135583947 [Musa acuminata AAA Group]|uniref:uncharacterized protein LOC135583947 n=1 Tax=Musa acuminata AAA Group TaxID=214697 RepID=UPI0031DDAD79